MNKKKLKGKSTYVRSIADELTEKDLLVAVKRIDDQTKELVNLSLECERLGIRHILISTLTLLSFRVYERQNTE